MSSTHRVRFASQHVSIVVSALVLLFLSTHSSGQTTQSTTDKMTPSGLTPGAPAGSYPLSGMENINLYNGNLDFHLPLLALDGRGSAVRNMMLSLNTKKWRVRESHTQTSDTYTPTTPNWGSVEVGYLAGKLQGRQSGWSSRTCTNPSIPSMEEVIMRVILIILFLSLFLITANGQTSRAFEKDYGKATDGYSVSANISMTPEYSSDGQVCRTRLYRKQLSNGAKSVSKALPFEELKEVLNQLIPPRLRGAIKEPFRVTELGGREGWTTYSYENVAIVFAFPVNIDPKDWKGPFTFPIERIPHQNNKPKRSFHEIAISRVMTELRL